MYIERIEIQVYIYIYIQTGLQTQSFGKDTDYVRIYFLCNIQNELVRRDPVCKCEDYADSDFLCSEEIIIKIWVFGEETDLLFACSRYRKDAYSEFLSIRRGL
jgi:hypothetical protein